MAKPTIQHTHTTKVAMTFARAEMERLVANAVLHAAGMADTPREAVKSVYFDEREIGHSGVREWVAEVTIDNAKIPHAVEG
ncbi:hypothetical protein HBF26_17080 [Luteibacter jiangsuensis]|uniref:Uncharacterized protein n=1 Tax=Luteibacter jiangsuensis TaxID=637577 RepID=A0ABX0Q8B9_9GAMM|nr:hypothetical protein [Luteibacter jiangsuensis]NID06611.1 hypothetical protein [Luteibacter jiangsuensis]